MENELSFVRYLHGKRVWELNPMFRSFIDDIFSFPNENLQIKCMKNRYKQKADIFIKIGTVFRGVSIKKGIKNSVHVERISDFIHFLIENKVSRDIVVSYLQYQYADGTTNGTGKKRLSIEMYKQDHQVCIDKINEALNQEDILNKAISRFVVRGRNSHYDISAILYGEIDDFLWITKEDIQKLIFSKKNEYSSAVHFGPLTCQPKNRCLNYNPKYEKDRFLVQIKWYNLLDDIIDNMNQKVKKSDFSS